jgi:transcription initiation factor IIF auxiliary subunit
MSPLAVEIRDSPFDPDDPKPVIRVKNPKTDRPLYQVFLYGEGPGLPFVESITYELHPTFNDPVKRVVRSVTNPRCKLVIWTWGLFTVKATIRDKTGRQEVRSHHLEYATQFSREGIEFLPG